MGALVPLSDASRRPARIPAVTALIILVNCFGFVLELAGGDAFVNTWSAIPAQIVSGHQWITLITSMFMHGSWSHIIGNMIFLWAFGPQIEDAMGRWRYLVFYFAGGLVAMLAQVAADPHSTVPNLGASGAIAGVMGAYFLLYPRARVLTLVPFFFVFFMWLPAWIVPGYWFVAQFLSGAASSITARGGNSSGIAFWAHVGGFLAGMLLIKVFPARTRRYHYGL